MNHTSEGQLQAFLDRELSAQERMAVEAHVAGCHACAAELESLRRAASLVAVAVAELDVPVPVAGAREAVRERAAAASQPIPLDPVARRRPDWTRTVRAALPRAAVLLLVGAGVAAAVPGSALNRLAVAAWAEAKALLGADEVVEVAPAPAAPATGNMGLPPASIAGELRVRLADVPAGTRIVVRWADEAGAEIEGLWWEQPSWDLGPGRLEAIGGRPDGDVTVQLPRGVAEITVDVNGRTYLRRQQGELRYDGPIVERRAAEEVVFRVGG
jgi:anti-sigma factor RsiW